MAITLLNGHFINSEQPALYADDRGFHYGDGIFETMLLQRGKVRFLEDHWQRLISGCERLALNQLDRVLFDSELSKLISGHDNGVVKFVFSRGRSERGYRALAGSSPTRLWQLHQPSEIGLTTSIKVRWCNTRLSRNSDLANIKHCNRLEQILALNEWQDRDINEGLMLDTDGELVCGTMSNVFLMIDEALVTPDLRFCGIHGVMRKNIIKSASSMSIPVDVRPVRAEEIDLADEIFLTNSIRGIQPVAQLDQQHWPVGKVTTRLMAALNDAV